MQSQYLLAQLKAVVQDQGMDLALVKHGVAQARLDPHGGVGRPNKAAQGGQLGRGRDGGGGQARDDLLSARLSRQRKEREGGRKSQRATTHHSCWAASGGEGYCFGQGQDACKGHFQVHLEPASMSRQLQATFKQLYVCGGGRAPPLCKVDFQAAPGNHFEAQRVALVGSHDHVARGPGVSMHAGCLWANLPMKFRLVVGGFGAELHGVEREPAAFLAGAGHREGDLAGRGSGWHHHKVLLKLHVSI